MNSTRAIGVRAEKRFYQAVRSEIDRPNWVVDVRPASALDDYKGGIDFVARVRRNGTKRCDKVPVQIKSSARGIKKFIMQHPELANAIILVVRESMSLDSIRKRFYKELERAIESEHSYLELFQRVRMLRLSQKDLRRIRIMKEERKEILS